MADQLIKMEDKFIKEIQRRFPNSDIENLEDALHRIECTEYEHIFSEEIKQLKKGGF